MKRFVFITAITAVLVATATAVFAIYASIKYDVTLVSFDGKASVTMEHISDRNKLTPTGFSIYSFALTDCVDFYSDYIITNSNYLYSLDGEANITGGETGRYVLHSDGRYFYYTQSGIQVVCRELYCGFFHPELVNLYTVSPFYAVESFSWQTPTEYKWSDTIGLKSFEDLVKFYERTESEHYRIDSENKTIYLSLYDGNTWYKDMATMKATDNGVEVALILDFEEE